MENAFSFPIPRRSKLNSNAFSSPISHIYTSSLDSFNGAPTSTSSTTPVASSETSSDTEEFEFMTAPSTPMSSNHYSKQHQPPVMDFADELFHDNQFLPLKLPPRLQYPSPPPPPPPRPNPRGSIWKLLGLSALGFNDKEFDPFTAAMKSIRKEGMSQRRKPGHSRSGEAAGSKWDSHEGSKKKLRKYNIIPSVLGVTKGKGGVKDEVSDHGAGVRELKNGWEQNGDDYNARMVDIKEMRRNRSLTRYKRSRAKFSSCFVFGPRCKISQRKEY